MHLFGKQDHTGSIPVVSSRVTSLCECDGSTVPWKGPDLGSIPKAEGERYASIVVNGSIRLFRNQDITVRIRVEARSFADVAQGPGNCLVSSSVQVQILSSAPSS